VPNVTRYVKRTWRLLLAKTPSALEPLTVLPRPGILPGSMLRILAALLPTLLSAMRPRRHLVIENLALRQQLATLAGRRHPDIRPADRDFWVLLRRYWCRCAEALAIVRPARSCAGIAPGSASAGIGYPDAGSAPAVLPCLGRSEHSSGGWARRIPGGAPRIQ
jgi:hypothetical protein